MGSSCSTGMTPTCMASALSRLCMADKNLVGKTRVIPLQLLRSVRHVYSGGEIQPLHGMPGICAGRQ